MAGLIEKIKNFFSGKFVCKPKKRPARPEYTKAGGEESKPQQEEPKPKEKPEEQK